MRKRRLSTGLVAMAAVVAALLAPHASWVRAQPVASITLPPPGETKLLYPGCNTVGLTFPDGTPSETVVQAVTPAEEVLAIWRYNAALDTLQGFSPEFPEVSDLVSVDFLDAVWLCMVTGAGGGLPMPPNRFLGNVTLDGAPAPAGIRVTATIGGNRCGHAPVEADPPYVLDILTKEEKAGCGTEGAAVEFWVGCSPAGSATWSRGQFTEVDLAALSDTDGDGCGDCQEIALGSVFDPTGAGWYDVYDVPVPAYPDPRPNGPRNKVVDIGDLLATLFYVFAEPTDVCGDNPNGNGVDYDCDKGIDTDGDTMADIPPDEVPDGRGYDRSPGLGPDPATGIDPAGPPNGVIDMSDVLAALAQAAAVDCSWLPPLSLLVYARAQVDCCSGTDLEVDLVDQDWQPVAGETVQCGLTPPDAPLVIIPQSAVTGAGGTAILSIVPTGAPCVPGEELTINCFVESAPQVRANIAVVGMTCAGPSVPPNRFFGDVTIEQTPAPPGTDVEASISGNICGQATVQPDSTYLLDVLSSGDLPGCGSYGAPVDFRVAGTPAGASTWALGRFAPLTLPVPGDATPTPTPTPLSTPEPTPTPAEGMEYVSLAVGCNAVASTYPDSTPIQTLADAVWPQPVLHAVWTFQASTWRGYSPSYPEASNLAEVDLLDVVFICVDGSATFARPQL